MPDPKEGEITPPTPLAEEPVNDTPTNPNDLPPPPPPREDEEG